MLQTCGKNLEPTKRNSARQRQRFGKRDSLAITILHLHLPPSHLQTDLTNRTDLSS